MFSNTFPGIAPSSAPWFIGAQVVGGIVALGLVLVLYPGLTKAESADIIVPHFRGSDDPETERDSVH